MIERAGFNELSSGGYMQTGKGVFVVIEGTDGSGKSTQFARLQDRLIKEGYDVATFKFPRYDDPSSFFVRQYLNGAYGSADEVGPYTASLFYALDRYAGAPAIRQALEEGKVVLVDRYVGSNMAHQGTKFQHAEERRGYFIWLDNLEFEMLHIPRPTLSVVLRVPAEISQKLIDQKEPRGYTDRKRDIHEADLDHLRRTVNVFDDMCQLFPKDFSRIDCLRGDEMLSIDTIHDIIWQKIEPMLPTKPTGKGAKPHVAKAETTAIKSSLVEQRPDGSEVLTRTGRQLLDEAVTNTSGQVYLLTDKLTPKHAAAILAHVAAHGGNVRELISDDSDVRAGLDDTAKHFANTSLVLEETSQLLVAKLARGRSAIYASQPPHTVQHDQKKPDGTYRYYLPKHLVPELTKQYQTHMNKLFDLYSGIVHGLTNHLLDTSTVPKDDQDAAWRSELKRQAYATARAALPVAATTTAVVHTSLDGLENVVRRLLGDPLPEARGVVETILIETKKADPEFLDRLNQAQSGSVITHRAVARQKVGKLARTYLSETYSSPTDAVQLTSVWPRNEFDIVPDMLYAHTTMPLSELRTAVTAWPYDKKLAVFGAYLGERTSSRQRPGRALEKIHYSWDIASSFAAFRDLQHYQLTEDLEWQELTPRFGYDVPQLIEDADLLEEFETAFETSLKLYSLLQEAGHHLEAQYATLLGHTMRWKVTYNARESFRLHEGGAGKTHPDTQKLVTALHKKLSEVHPLLGEAMQLAPTETLLTAKVQRS